MDTQKVIGIALLAVMGLLGAKYSDQTPVKPKDPFTAAQNDNNLQYKGRYQMEKVIKESMNDPDSYKFDDLQVTDATETRTTLVLKYRGTNAFGGVITSYATGVLDGTGQLISIEKQ